MYQTTTKQRKLTKPQQNTSWTDTAFDEVALAEYTLDFRKSILLFWRLITLRLPVDKNVGNGACGLLFNAIELDSLCIIYHLRSSLAMYHSRRVELLVG
jgi:hypothetical protein